MTTTTATTASHIGSSARRDIVVAVARHATIAVVIAVIAGTATATAADPEPIDAGVATVGPIRTALVVPRGNTTRTDHDGGT